MHIICATNKQEMKSCSGFTLIYYFLYFMPAEQFYKEKCDM